MADDVTVDNGAGTDYDVATDDDGSGNHIQLFKQTYSADGTRTPIPADADGLLVNLGTNNDVTVSGVSTAANQTTMIGHLDGVEGLLTTIDADTGALAGTVSGSELQVDIVSAPTLTVNSHAVTNAGTFAVQATVAAGATTIGKAEDAAHTTADVGVPALAVRRDTAAVGSDTDGDYSTLNVDANGRLHVNVGNTVTVASHAVTNAGTFATQVDGAALTALQLIDDPVFTDDAAFTPGTSKVMMIGAQADDTSTDSVNEGDAGAVRMSLDRKLYVTVAPNDVDGLSIFRTLDADETEEDVKTSAGKLYGWYIYNDGAAEVYVKFYNATAANTTVGSTTPIMTLGIPAGSGSNVEFTNGIAFSTALCIAATTGVGDADTTAPAANQCVANVFYK